MRVGIVGMGGMGWFHASRYFQIPGGELAAIADVRPLGWGWQNWFLDPTRSGGTLYDLHIHDVDFVNYYLGAPQRVMASARQAQPGTASQVIQILFQYSGGPQVSIQAGWSEVQVPFKAGYEAWFEGGFIP